jgi:tetratricopeptide (TPR) repeat protein
VTAALTSAYATIQRVPDRIASFREAGYQVVALNDRQMSPQQHLNVCYLLAIAYAADEEYAQALHWLDGALEVARTLEDVAAEADLLFLRGPVAQRLDRYDQALDDYRTALALQTTLRREQPAAVDRAQELHLLVVAAAYALTQEEYALTRRLLVAARRVARHVGAAPGTLAYHDWIWAGYLDAHGQLERALQPALRAVTTAAEDGTEPYMVVRIGAFAARLAADLAATYPAQSVGRSTYVHMAASCLQVARRALAPTDRAGRGFLEVRQARLDALHGRETQALERIGAAEQLARELDDAPLLSQALTMHGHLLAERREGSEAALRLYREALALADARKVPYAAMPARRALRQLEERLPHEHLGGGIH